MRDPEKDFSGKVMATPGGLRKRRYLLSAYVWKGLETQTGQH